MKIHSFTIALLAVLALPAPLSAQLLPRGTHIPVRFLHALTGSVDTTGTRVVVQTMAAVASGNCVAVPAFVPVFGVVMGSRTGARGGGAGSLRLQFDSLVVRDTARPFSAVLDTLEYEPPAAFRDSGLIVAARHRGARLGLRMLPSAALATVDVALIPVALLAGLEAWRRGPKLRILAGEVGGIRLTEPLDLGAPTGACRPPTGDSTLVRLPALPRFVPLSTGRGGNPGDPMNILLLGAGAAVDSAFRAAGWVRTGPHSLGALRREIVAAVENRPALAAPVSTQYFEGRAQDLAYERTGPTARSRHHIRLWLLDSLAMVWIGAANEDVGLLVWRLRLPTHRIEADVDAERDRVATELEAGGCADLVDYVMLPGAGASGRNATGQRFRTDRRTAVIAVGRCRAAP